MSSLRQTCLFVYNTMTKDFKSLHLYNLTVSHSVTKKKLHIIVLDEKWRSNINRNYFDHFVSLHIFKGWVERHFWRFVHLSTSVLKQFLLTWYAQLVTRRVFTRQIVPETFLPPVCLRSKWRWVWVIQLSRFQHARFRFKVRVLRNMYIDCSKKTNLIGARISILVDYRTARLFFLCILICKYVNRKST